MATAHSFPGNEQLAFQDLMSELAPARTRLQADASATDKTSGRRATWEMKLVLGILTLRGPTG